MQKYSNLHQVSLHAIFVCKDRWNVRVICLERTCPMSRADGCNDVALETRPSRRVQIIYSLYAIYIRRRVFFTRLVEVSLANLN